MWKSSLLKKFKKVIITKKISSGQERNIGKPSYLLLHMVLIVLGIGSAVIERAKERRKNDILN